MKDCTQVIWKYTRFFCGNQPACEGHTEEAKRQAAEISKTRYESQFLTKVSGYIQKQLTFFKKKFFSFFFFSFLKQRKNKQIKKYYNTCIFDQYRP